MTLAAAAGSPVFAEQVRHARETGEMRHISRDELLNAIFRVSRQPGGERVGARALVQLGHNPREAEDMAMMTTDIVRKAGSFENFRMLIDGRGLKEARLDPREMALLRSVSRGQAASVWDGRTWEGSAMRVRPGGKPIQRAIWDGRTWEGSAM